MSSSTKEFKPLPKAFRSIDFHFWDGKDLTIAKPLVELEMTRLSAALRSKPLWYNKCRDQDILTKWRTEALEQAKLMKESHVDYVLKELNGYANMRDEETGVEVACYDRIWQSDKLVPTTLKAKLVAGVAKLEDVPESDKDWHPQSNDLVLDLVHPSLYPIVYDRTLAYPEGSSDRDVTKLDSIPPPPPPTPRHPAAVWGRQVSYHTSQKFQWLPTDFVVSDDGKTVRSVNYINNLHPDQHANLHAAIEELIGAFMPLFERVLTDSIPSNKAVPERTNNEYSYDDSYKPEPDYRDFADDADEFDILYKEWSDNRPIQLPDVSSEGYVLGSLEKRDIWYSLAGRTIQVIVKLANIHLTPEKPEYMGGSWHVEGMSNEAIAASGIYYYSEENITESRLAFRTAASIPIGYEQDDERGEDPCVNELGAVVTCRDRAVAFPNVYQHRVSPFELKDKTQPGHRKIVALFLVDPAIRRPSTTTVPPQQQDWRSAAVLSNETLKAAFDKLSSEIIDRVNSLAEGTMTREEANTYRLELMDERKAFVAENNDRFFEVAFNIEYVAGILAAHARELVKLSQTCETWRKSKYGSFVKIVDDNSLSELRRFWTYYANFPSISSVRLDKLQEQYTALAAQLKNSVNDGISRSATVVWEDASQSVSDQFGDYWKNGTTATTNKELQKVTTLNSTVFYSMAHGETFDDE
ncbi:hypothetical protein FRC07_013481 [Ceratobasidium sp. 392]|nr:hypothetical protein FRC07_013481 [Ceratobasidium sp. 392]